MSVRSRFVQQRRSRIAVICIIASFVGAVPAIAQSGAATTEAATASATQANDDAVLNLAEPDFVVVNLPTTLRLPRYRGNFRLTHRFAGNLRNGTLGQQAGNLFGIDQGAIIGFEYRFAVATHVQAAFYRSSFDKTIQLYGKYDAVQQRRSIPVSISPVASIEGADNFKECVDCHSEATRWPWYAALPVASHLIARDVRQARGQLNLSRWTQYNPFDRADMLDKMCQLSSSSRMPPWQYRMLHPDARLSAKDVAALCDWTRDEAARLVEGER